MSQETDTDQPQQIRLNYRILGRMPAIYAQHAVIQGQAEAVLISFFEAIFPPKPGYSAEDVQQMKEVGVVGECVARIAMPIDSFIETVKAMNELVGKIKPNAQVKEEEAKDADLSGN